MDKLLVGIDLDEFEFRVEFKIEVRIMGFER